MGMDARVKRVLTRTIRLILLSLPLIVLFNNCQKNLNSSELSESAQTSSSDVNGHGYSGKVNYISYAVLPSEQSVDTSEPEGVISVQENEVRLTQPALKDSLGFELTLQDVRKLSPGNPYYIEYQGRYFFREGFKMYQGSDPSLREYRTPILGICQSNSVSAQAAGISNMDVVVAAFVKPSSNDEGWSTDQKQLATHVVVTSRSDAKKIEYEKSFFKKMEFKGEVVESSLVDHPHILLKYAFLPDENDKKSLQALVQFRGKSVEIECHLVDSVEKLLQF
jgi:hypothetical protein